VKKQLLAALSLVASASALAGGYEKALLWSGHYTGMGGAAASTVSGSESLFFNPAGLASNEGIETSLNISPTSTQTKGPLLQDNVVVDSQRMLRWPFGLTAKMSLSPELAVGAGFMVAGGIGSEFSNVSFASLGLTAVNPSYMSKMSIAEFALGAAYKPMPGLKVGASWRASFVSAQFQYFTTPSTALGSLGFFSVDISGLKDSNFAGFRFGAQFEPEGTPFGVGVAVRTPINFTANGTISGQYVTSAATPTALTGSTASVKSSFPLQIAVGAHYKVQDNATVAVQYDMARYSANKMLDFTGSVMLGTTPITALPADITQNWKNMHNIRLGYEQGIGEGITLRAGYVFTSQVTPKEYPMVTFASPGVGHTIALGGGYAVDSNLRMDLGLEYAFASGNVTVTPLNGTSKLGTYSSNAFAGHLGVTYAL
jgi:long-chain fatty acid transport protein